MVRLPSKINISENEELKKGSWTPEEDEKLIEYMQKHGVGSWQFVPKKAGLNRCGKSCRLRWTNYLRPDIKRGNFSLDEEQTIIHLHSILGNKWSTIATSLPGRTDNEIKNYWNTSLKKKLIRSGIDPNTHQPLTTQLHNFFDLNLPSNSIAMIPNPNLILENLAKIQLLHNILQLLNTNPVPNLLGGSSQNLSQFYGLFHEISNHKELMSSMAPNLENINPLISSNFTPILETIPEFPHSNNESNNKDNFIPALVFPEINLSSDQTHSVVNSEEIPNYDLLFMNSSNADIIWKTEMEDEANSSFWKDIFI
ncbi:hypothetical protein ACJIZ3_009677 [Penstemon smallii]|uniref:Uncharacterized protein n=1 Tax=Penstemon smallii TaxID=265156 RepID=A0ABD3TEA6_9LAMI